MDELIKKQTNIGYKEGKKKQQTGEKMTGKGSVPLLQKECWQINEEATNSPREGPAKEINK